MGKFAKKFQDIGLLYITDTVQNWHNLFLDSACAKIVMNSLSFCIRDKRIELFCYVLMPNHYHLIVKMGQGHRVEDFLRDFNKFTSQKILFYLKDMESKELPKFYVGTKKQRYRIWMRDVDIKNVVTSKFLLQKAEYIHNNPLSPKWREILRLDNSWEYPYSSARFYIKNIKDDFVELSDLRVLL